MAARLSICGRKQLKAFDLTFNFLLMGAQALFPRGDKFLSDEIVSLSAGIAFARGTKDLSYEVGALARFGLGITL
jgi:hypothetical protein